MFVDKFGIGIRNFMLLQRQYGAFPYHNQPQAAPTATIKEAVDLGVDEEIADEPVRLFEIKYPNGQGGFIKFPVDTPEEEIRAYFERTNTRIVEKFSV